MKDSTHLGIITSLWGAWLLVPCWETFAASPTFAVMTKIMPEETWGLGFFILGICLLIVDRYKQIKVEIVFSFLITFLWGLVTVTFILSNLTSTGVPLYGWLTFYSADTTTQLLRRIR